MKIEEKKLSELTEKRYELYNDIQKLKRKLKIKENELEYIKRQIVIEISIEEEENKKYSVCNESDNILLSKICKVFHDI